MRLEQDMRLAKIVTGIQATLAASINPGYL